MASSGEPAGTLLLEPDEGVLATAVPTTAHRWAGLELLGLLAYQAFHQLEHAIEAVQLRLLHHDHAHTLLGGVDFEWLHFGANAVLLFGLAAVAVAYGPAARARWRRSRPVGWVALIVALAVQGGHVLDHTVRVVQYVTTGGEPAGTLTRYLDPVWFHFGINLTVLVAMAVAFFGLGIHRELPLGRSRHRS